MKRILVILLSLFSFAAVFANEITDSANNITSHSDRLFYESSKSTINAYRQMVSEVSLDTTYAQHLVDYALVSIINGKFDEASQALSEASNIYKEVYGHDSNEYATWLDNLVVIYDNLGNYDEAIRLGTEALEITARKVGTDHPDYARWSGNLAVYYAALGNYEEAIRLGTEALEITERTVGTDHSDYTTWLGNLVVYYYNLGNYEEAIRLGMEALEITGRTVGTVHPEYATWLASLASYYDDLGHYDVAIRLGTEALEITGETDGTDHPDYALRLGNLANYNYHLGNYDEAIRLGTEALEITERTVGTDHSDYATPLGNLAIYYAALGNYEEAIRLGTEALEITVETVGTNNPDYARWLGNLAKYNYALGNYEEAIRLGTEALEITGRTVGTDHPNYATWLGNLATYYHSLGNYDEAIRLGTEALEITGRTVGVDHPDYASWLNNLATYYHSLGNYDEAIRLGTEALEITGRTVGTDHLDYARWSGNIAEYYHSLGNYDEAIRLGTEALEITGRTVGTNNPDYARWLGNLAKYNYYLSNYDEAIRLGTEALEITGETVGTDHPDYASWLNNLAMYIGKLGDYDEAIRLRIEAKEITGRTVGVDHPDYAIRLGNLAYDYYALGNYEEALRLGTEALEITERTVGTDHSDYATWLGNLAECYNALGGYDEVVRLFTSYAQVIRKNVLGTFSGLSANERQIYWNKYRSNLNERIPRVFIHSKIPTSSSTLYDNVALFSKGLLLSTELEMSKLIQESGDDEAKKMYSELRQNRQILNFQYSKPIAERNINCDSLERVSADLERKLGSRVQEFGDFTKNLSITWKDVQSKLDDSDLAIEFLSYPEYGGSMYVALTLCKNDTVPLLTPLFTESQLKDVAGDDGTYQNAVSDSLIWGPLASRMEGKSRIYFSAAGMLHGIGIEYLPSMKGKECYRLSSTRELVTHKPSEGIKSATLFGGIDYDATYALIKSSAPSTPNNPSDLSDPSTILYAENTAFGPIIYKQGGRGGLDEYNSMRTLRYSVRPLPGSRKEIQAVSALLKESKFNVQYCDTITSNLASEESFKALSGQRRSLIHISTHGFYYDTIQAKNKGKHLRMMLMSDDRPSRSEDKSLLRCGLCFAGANQFLREMKNPAEGQDEGILNALEIAQTDLRGLDLVVLSACQTALGDVVNGEGVFGLQRGFKKAGAQSILMSLWKVDDDITALLMTEFYKAWTSSPEVTKTAALKAAQDVVKEKYPDPDAWAGFILLDALD